MCLQVCAGRGVLVLYSAVTSISKPMKWSRYTYMALSDGEKEIIIHQSMNEIMQEPEFLLDHVATPSYIPQRPFDCCECKESVGHNLATGCPLNYTMISLCELSPYPRKKTSVIWLVLQILYQRLWG